MHARPCLIMTLLGAVIVMLSGCATSPLTRYYLLEAGGYAQGERRDCSEESTTVIGIGPIDIPRYLDRPQIVTMVGANEMTFSELDQWGEPFKDGIARVIAQELQTLLCAEVRDDPWQRSGRAQYRLKVTVSRLEGTFGGEAVLAVHWILTEERTRQVLLARDAHLSAAVKTPDYHGLIAAYSDLIAAFSRTVAETMAETLWDTHK